MDRGSVESIVKALNEHSVRYLIADGLAVIAHGYVRFTAVVDIILDLDESNARRALEALSRLGYRPRLCPSSSLRTNMHETTGCPRKA